MRSNVLLGVVLGTVFAAGIAVGALQQQAAGGTRREPQFENDQVEVWKTIIMPNQPLALHRHDHGRTIVALKGGTLDIVDGNGKTLHQEKWESGKAYWLGVDPPGQKHGDLNRGKEPMEVIVVQLKK
jgi:quercetin dioxygenase-like cupin family protein